jgi:hypothetical protein
MRFSVQHLLTAWASRLVDAELDAIEVASVELTGSTDLMA